MSDMHSFVATRPPRVPKPLSCIATNTVDASTFIHHQQNSSHFDNHRSSSQPRASQSQSTELESEISVPTINPSRSASQPRSLQTSHFLDGFNVADCFDVRAIPDPPSPTNSKCRHRRRVSSSVLRPMSSRDVTNRGNNQGLEGSDTATITGKSGSSARRKRKTLSHVPSPLVPEDKQNYGFPDNQGREENNDVEKKPKNLRIKLCHDDDEDAEMITVSPKRRKKRQSMVIPSNIPFQDDGTKSSNSDSFMGIESPLKKKNKIFPGDLKIMQELRYLVRSYCGISSETERGFSEEAKSILEITGYQLPKKNMTTTGSNNSRAILSNRRLVIQKIAPVLTQMEKRRERDTKQWESDTKCRVTKSVKSGRYRYYDVESNQKISSQEYKRRYITVLEDSRSDRLARAQAWMTKIDQGDELIAESQERSEYPDPSGTELVKMINVPKSMEKKEHLSENLLVSEEPIVFGIVDRQEQNRIEKNSMKQKEAFSPPINNNNLVRLEGTGSEDIEVIDRMDICDLSMSLDYGERSSCISMTNNSHLTTKTLFTGRGEIAEISEASSEDTDENQLESRTSSPTNTMVNGAVTEMPKDGLHFETANSRDKRSYISDGRMGENRSDKTHTTDIVSNHSFSLPSRDTESIDPEIAQAERRLWDKIDLALHEYSKEIMLISEKK
mmetsp:Transcript_583/g.644  ORF Transcript_583/g.644 Transcript_583/m.644 type:complete len:671 (-) Transcript_583:884-2896(-)